MDVLSLGISPTLLALLVAANLACFISGVALGFAVATYRENQRRIGR